MENVGGVKNVNGLLVNTNMAGTVDTKLTKTPYKKEKFTEHQLTELALCMKDPKYFLMKFSTLFIRFK